LMRRERRAPAGLRNLEFCLLFLRCV
jgi:hypothetical protein